MPEHSQISNSAGICYSLEMLSISSSVRMSLKVVVSTCFPWYVHIYEMYNYVLFSSFFFPSSQITVVRNENLDWINFVKLLGCFSEGDISFVNPLRQSQTFWRRFHWGSWKALGSMSISDGLDLCLMWISPWVQWHYETLRKAPSNGDAHHCQCPAPIGPVVKNSKIDF